MGRGGRGRCLTAETHRIQVRLLDSNGTRVTQARTDREGRFAFRELCPDTYTVCPGTPCPAGAPGGPAPSRYLPATREIRVPPALQNGVDFEQLPPPPLKQPDPERQ